MSTYYQSFNKLIYVTSEEENFEHHSGLNARSERGWFEWRAIWVHSRQYKVTKV